jgi:hypothetical protein
MLTYTNPRMTAVIPDWPSGRHRVTATFTVETDPKRGQRVIRTTTGKGKATTYAVQARIVTGSDGRTYVAMLTPYDFVGIMRSDLKIQHESIHRGDPRLPELLKLFE